ncbi:PAS domain S-box protein [Rhodohalobacter sp. SW132]|uniref:PAS domain S-box protein n=1 Tax=Rhodohalobacter sp. SW132 TaxID=2293433 RepID=UPI000E22E19A|nr:PAS domain S-box protein [Rhodohalobacter sp. SW132]REL37978.1 PAS domain S-box protein [Rhodohalobacter sp. SW132]
MYTQSNQSFFNSESIFVVDIDSLYILDANSHAIEQYGYSIDELKSKKITDLGKRVELTGFEGPDLDQSVIHPRDVWVHRSKDGTEWMVQMTHQKFRHAGRAVKMAIAHNIDHLISDDEVQISRLPKIDLIRTQMPFGLIEWNSKLVVQDFSEKAEMIFSADHAEVIGKKAEDLLFLPDKFVNQFRERISSRIENGDTYFVIESKIEDPLYDQKICLWHNTVMRSENGELLSVYSLIEDVTDQRKSYVELQKSETKFRVMNEQSFVGIYILKDRSFVYANPRLTEITGYSEKELLDDIKFRDLVHPDDIAHVNEQRKIWEANPKESYDFSIRIISKSGEVLHIKTYGSSIEKDGERALLGVVTDQTQQIKALESYQSLFDCINDSMYIQDVDGTFIEVNKEVENTTGYSKEEIIGKDPSFLAAPGKVDMEDANRKFKKALTGKPQSFRWWGKKKNGEIYPKDIKLSQGNFFGQDVVIAVARDVTEQVRREEELKRNEELFEQLFRNSPLGIAMLNRDSEIVQVNDSFESMFGYSEDEIVGENLDDLIVPESEIEEAKALSDRKTTFTLTKRRKTKSGELIDVFIYGVPVVIDGETIAIYGIYTDITDRIRAEDKVKQSLEEKEILLAEIHHRVKNNLAVITGLLELQFHNLESAEAKSALRDSQMRINSMALIHEKLYQNESLSNIDFGVYIDELVRVIVKSHSKEGVNVNVKMEADPIDLPITKAIPCGLIINEIVTNSMKYAFPADHENPEIAIQLKQKNGGAQILISDNGIGLEKPFEQMGGNSLGTLLIRTLSSQLEAEMDVDGSDGTCYKLSFDLEKS